MWDGVAFDAHQHKRNIQAVDFQFYDVYLETILLGLDIPVEYWSVIKDYMYNLDVSIVSYVQSSGKRLKLMEGKINATTFSGDPCRTTGGNSQRMGFANAFIANEAGLYTSIVSDLNGASDSNGADDVVIVVEDRDIEAYLSSLF